MTWRLLHFFLLGFKMSGNTYCHFTSAGKYNCRNQSDKIHVWLALAFTTHLLWHVLWIFGSPILDGIQKPCAQKWIEEGQISVAM